MDTNLLNQYLFANLIEQEAHKVRRSRVDKDPSSVNAITESDLKEAFENLNYYRAVSLKLLNNAGSID